MDAALLLLCAIDARDELFVAASLSPPFFAPIAMETVTGRGMMESNCGFDVLTPEEPSLRLM